MELNILLLHTPPTHHHTTTTTHPSLHCTPNATTPASTLYKHHPRSPSHYYQAHLPTYLPTLHDLLKFLYQLYNKVDKMLANDGDA